MKKITIIAIINLCLVIGLNAQILGSKPKSFDFQMKALTRQMVKSFGEQGKTQIAIMEFPNVNGTITELGKLIPEELTTRLFQTGEFQVVERQLLNKVLQEQKLGMSGMIDASSAAQIGKLLGVDAIVTGTVTDRGDAIRINARMIETEKAHVFAVASVSVIRENHLIGMLGKEISAPANNSSSGSSAKPASNKPIAKGLLGEVKLEIMSIKVDGMNKATVEVVFTNKAKQDVNMILQPNHSQAYDNLGQEYVCQQIITGSKKTRYNSSTINHRFISGIPTKVYFKFYDIDSDASSVALLKLSAEINREDVSTEFRKIKVGR